MPQWVYYIASLIPLLGLANYLRQCRRLLPPGPPGIPLLGNVLDLDGYELWRKANKWGHSMGEFVCLQVFGMPIVFIERGEAAIELLNRRSTIYSDRPRLVMAGEMCAMDNFVPLTHAGARLKLDRKLMNQALSPSTIKQWRPATAREVLLLLRNLKRSPDGFIPHFNRLAGSLILKSVYGYQVGTDHDALVEIAEEMMGITSYAIATKWVVDVFTFLRWVPGMTCRKIAKKWRAAMLNWAERSYDAFIQLPDSDDKRNSFCGTLLLGDDGKVVAEADVEERVKWIAVSMFGGGQDTTVATLTIFVMSMVLNPHVQRKAQAEIDKVLGLNRLPNFEDRPRLPYVDCILKETLRWGTPVPLTIPHRLMQSDTYNEYTFPAGTMFNANIWSMLHDERIYPNPHQFLPERFMELDKAQEELRSTLPVDPYVYAFGFGRRRCPGLNFADQTLWLAIASILTCFDISPFTDANGVSALPKQVFDGGVVRHPKPFKCRFTLRRENLLNMLESEEMALGGQ